VVELNIRVEKIAVSNSDNPLFVAVRVKALDWTTVSVVVPMKEAHTSVGICITRRFRPNVRAGTRHVLDKPWSSGRNYLQSFGFSNKRHICKSVDVKFRSTPISKLDEIPSRTEIDAKSDLGLCIIP
jgi:hypothetical protein